MADAVTDEIFRYRISSVFGTYHFFKAVGWYRVVKDNSIGNMFAKMLTPCLEHFSDSSNTLHSGTLSTSFGKLPLVALSRRKVRPRVFRSSHPLP